MTVSAFWCGAVTPTGATVAAKAAASDSCRLAVSTSSALTSPAYSSAVTATSNGWAKLPITGLTANTQYYYAVEVNGVLDAGRGKFRTFPTAGAAASFSFVAASCSYNDNGAKPIYAKMAAHSPLLFAQLGDMFYRDYGGSWYPDRLMFIDQVHTSSQTDLFHATTTEYVWDDHDWGQDNSDRTAPSGAVTAQAYRETFPSYPLSDTATLGVWTSWQVGRVWFIKTDLHSYRDPDATTDSSLKTMLGAEQKAWFKSQLDAAATANAPLIFWLSTNVWTVAPGNSDSDHWGQFTFERAELANYIKSKGLTSKMVILSGDAHMLANSAGNPADYASGGGAAIPEFVNAAMDHPEGIVKGTAWTAGPIANAGMHYGLVTVSDDGTTVGYTWQGMAVAADGTESVALSYSTVSSPFTASHPVKVWDGTQWGERSSYVWTGSQWTRRKVYA